jgi:hypothetical protein
MYIKNLLKLNELYANKMLYDQERLWVCGFALIGGPETLEGSGPARMAGGLSLEYQGSKRIMDDFSKSLRALRERTVSQALGRLNAYD